MKTRAIYIPDARYETMPILELKEDKFVCRTDIQLSYPIDVVLSDSDWMIISIEDEKVENIR